MRQEFTAMAYKAKKGPTSGWRLVYFGLAVQSLGLALLFWMLLKTSPKFHCPNVEQTWDPATNDVTASKQSPRSPDMDTLFQEMIAREEGMSKGSLLNYYPLAKFAYKFSTSPPTSRLCLKTRGVRVRSHP